MARTLEQLVKAAYDAKAPLAGEVILEVPRLAEILAPLLGDLDADEHGAEVGRILRDFRDELIRAEDAAAVGRSEFSRLTDAQRALLVCRMLTVKPVVGNRDNRGGYFNLTERRNAQLELEGWKEGDHTKLFVRMESRQKIGAAFASELKAYVARQEPSRHDLEERSTKNPQPPSAVLDALADHLDEHPQNYPPELTQLVLASNLTVSRVEHAGQLSHSRSLLYGGSPSYGGAAALGALKNERRTVLFGDPGGGKTTMLRALVVEQLRTTAAPALFVRLSDVLRHMEERRGTDANRGPVGVFLDTVLERMDSVNEATRQHLLQRFQMDQHALLALDGIDEVLSADGMWRLQDLLRKLESFPGRIVISSRHIGYWSPPGTWVEYSVDRMSAEQQACFIDSWFTGRLDGSAALRAMSALESGGVGAQGLGEVPVLLGFIASIAESGDVPHSAGELYERYLELFLAQVWKPSTRSGVRLLQQMRLARRLGWLSVVRERDGQVTPGWADTVRYGELLQMVDANEQPDVEELVRHDGLFVWYGARADTELQRELRWIHRTVHEHLVGMYLAELLKNDPSAGLAFVGLAAQWPSQWTVPLTHALMSLSDSQQERVFEHLHDLERQGDPGGAIFDTSVNLARVAAPCLTAPAAILERLWAMNEWGRASRIDEAATDRHLIEGILDGSIPSGGQRTEYYYFAGNVEPSLIRQAVETLLAAEPITRTHTTLLRLLLTSYSEQNVDDAYALLITAVQRGVYLADGTNLWGWEAMPQEMTIAAVIEAARQTSWPQGVFSLLGPLIRAGVDVRLFAEPSGPLNPVQIKLMYQVFMHGRADRSLSAVRQYVPDEVLAAGLEGAAGDMIAYLLASHGMLKRGVTEAPSPAAVLGDLVNDWELAAEQRLEVLAARELPMPEEAARMLSTLPPDWYASVDCLTRILEAAAAFYVSPERGNLKVLLAVYRANGTVPVDAFELAGLPLSVLIVGGAVVDTLERHDARDVLASLLETSSSEWAATGGYLGILANLLSAPGIGVSDARRVVDWAADGGLTILPSLIEVPMSAPHQELVDELLADPDRHFKDKPVNIFALGSRLERTGLLARYRDQLLTLLKVAT